MGVTDVTFTITPPPDGTVTGPDDKIIGQLITVVKQFVTAANWLCKLGQCTTEWKVPIDRLKKLSTIGDLANAIKLSTELGKELKKANKVLRKQGRDSRQFCEQMHVVFKRAQELHRTFNDISPILVILLPAPAGDLRPCP
jgi:hypothetical protein